MWPHPSSKIKGEESEALKGKNIVLGVTGSVACYKAIDLARALMRRGADVYPVLSPSAADLISPQLFEWATGRPALVEFGGETGHVQFAENASSMIIAPATANTLSKIAWGVADTPVTLTAIIMRGAGKPVGLVPVMHVQLYRSPQVRSAIERLESLGYSILPPVIEGDKAKIPEPKDIALFTETITLRGRDLKGLKVLVTAGPTREHLDPVRFLSNPSSGRMGVAVAKEAFYRGASVTLVHGPLSVPPPPWVRRVTAVSAEDMLKSILKEIESDEYNAVILAGAPADFKFSSSSTHKIDSTVESMTVKLIPTPKIIAEVRRRKPGMLIVGFAAETVTDEGELVERAIKKLRRYDVDVIIANNVSRADIGFQSTMNEVYIVDREEKVQHIPKSTKEEVARRVLDEVRKRLKD